jgi:hypothetical protein
MGFILLVYFCFGGVCLYMFSTLIHLSLCLINPMWFSFHFILCNPHMYFIFFAPIFFFRFGVHAIFCMRMRPKCSVLFY